MKVQKLPISSSCEFTITTFEGIEHKNVCLEYTEHSPDGYYSDSETSIDIAADKAREIVVFMHAAFPEIAPPAREWVGLTEEQQNDLVYNVFDLRTRMELVIGTEAKLKEKNNA
jgi:hypothetical protein